MQGIADEPAARYADQSKPRGRKPAASKASKEPAEQRPKAKAKSHAQTKAKSRAKAKAKSQAKEKPQTNKTSKKGKGNTAAKPNALEQHSIEAEPAVGVGLKRAADAESEPSKLSQSPVKLQDLIDDPSLPLPALADLGDYFRPPSWVTGNNVYSLIYRSSGKGDPETGRKVGKFATRVWRQYQVVLSALTEGSSFRAEKPKPRAKRAKKDVPGHLAEENDGEDGKDARQDASKDDIMNETP